MAKDYSREMIFQTYVADCLGMLLRNIYQNDSFALYSDIIHKDKRPKETAKDVIAHVKALFS